MQKNYYTLVFLIIYQFWPKGLQLSRFVCQTSTLENLLDTVNFITSWHFNKKVRLIGKLVQFH